MDDLSRRHCNCLADLELLRCDWRLAGSRAHDILREICSATQKIGPAL